MKKFFVRLFFCIIIFSSSQAIGYASPGIEQKCSDGFERIPIALSHITSVSSPSIDDVGHVVSYIQECVKRFYSSKERSSFRELVKSSLELLEKKESTRLYQSFKDVGSNNENSEQKKRDLERLERLERLMTALEWASLSLNKNLPLEQGWGKDFTANFYLGYEGVSVAGFKEKGTTRTGLLVYNQITGPLEGGYHLNTHLKTMHIFGNVLLTSSAEETVNDNATDVISAFEVDFNAYFPFWSVNQQIGLLAFGPISNFSIRKADSDSEYTKRSYHGIRLAHSPESFLDLLYGTVVGIKGKRIELKGQLPLVEISKGRFFVGGIANLGVHHGAPEKSDALKLYVIWQIRWSELLG